MAFGTDSKIFRSFLTDLLSQSQAHDLDLAGNHKVALFNNTTTPDQNVTTALSGYAAVGSQWVTANEVISSTDTANQWAAGGRVLPTPTVTNPANGIVMFDAADVSSGTNATLANVYGGLVYSDNLTNDPGICYLSFGGAQAVSGGTFSVIWSSSGIARFTL